MAWNEPVLWWALAGVLVVVELLTGTFYLLMLALGAAAAAVAAHLGLGGTQQVLAFAAVGGGAVAVWHWRRAQSPRSAPADSNRDVHLDIGERVTVEAWAPDGTARVNYRGSQWSARLAPGAAAPAPGPHRVQALDANWLVLVADNAPA
ncbi:MAG: hypothetical protein CFE46_03580 [Burkholderiales bacterium PBB6]|nr:MAG: hypothetical protein CFE46_03580 [Burkholderiales bacterium PBB6]